ncbi:MULTISPECIES: PhzF family phenazine biosynthesis protein [Pandoraea]|uniref:PhzF family phenazine biosynthesis protein n=1 Tax=Pandoraea TaxID=93217 RepID=UPI001F5E27FB|nr:MULTISPECIES: PhzF family phenazine biosynthesis protein [Pandoraea]MCI3207492.1 phenazine biosynthesis protein PhzC/PhzF [Pandoraea sp. LA3]MDN4585521.1 phenazine biosynthesis protein PhzC/PhzF [Pandoraea capi]
MSRSYAFRIVNVFAESTFGGNPLCVFEDARGMSDDEMRSLARQFNLSETTFILPSETADAHVRIFTPGYEMRFAGHPTLGTAHVLRAIRNLDDKVVLQFAAGLVPVQAKGDHWTLTAPSTGEPKIAKAHEADSDIAALVRLTRDDLAQSPQWVDTGADQLLIPLRNAEAVARAQPDSAKLERWPLSSLERKTGYVFSIDDRSGDELQVTARYFFTTQGGGVSEDPGTGSACANLGGWLIGQGYPLPVRARVSQGDAVERPCRLTLEVTVDREIRVGGNVIELARGEVRL